MALLPILAVGGLLGVLVGLAVFLVLQQKQQAHQLSNDAAAEPVVLPQGGRRGLQNRRLRQRHAAAQQQQAAAAAAARGGGSDSDEEDDDGDEAVPRNRREARRMERAEAREAEAAAREARAAKISAYEERRKKKEADREAREEAQAEEIRRAAEEKQRAEDEEAAKWLSQISVEDTGTVEEAAATEDQGLLGRFIEYIIARKMVPIEEAATEFGLRSTEVVDRIQGLEAMGRISGVMDERGKFIYISRPEMEAVAAHIRAKGRVSIAALAAASNNLIDLEAKSAAALAAAGGAAGPGPAIDFDALAGGGDAEPVAA